MTLGKASQASAVALALMFGAGLALFGPSAASASVLPAQTAAVLSASATPAQLPATGGTVTVTARVANATSCQLQLLSSQSFTVVYSHNPKDCSADYSARVTIGPNTTAVTRTVAFGPVVPLPGRGRPRTDRDQHVRPPHHDGPRHRTAGARQRRGELQLVRVLVDRWSVHCCEGHLYRPLPSSRDVAAR